MKVKAWFFGKNLFYLQYLKKVSKWPLLLLDFSENVFLYYSWLAFCKMCLSEKILGFELLIKKFGTNNMASFYKFNIFAFFNDFLVDDVIPWG